MTRLASLGIHLRQGRIVFAGMLISAFMVSQSVDAQMAIFPGTASQVIDGGPGDADGIMNDTISVTSITVPNTGGALTFTGKAEWRTSVAAGGKIGTASLDISDAMITNTTAGVFNLGGAANEFPLAASDVHGEFSGVNVFGAIDVKGRLDPPGVTASVPPQALSISLFDQGADFLPGPGVIGPSLTASWTFGTTVPVEEIKVTAGGNATTTTGSGRMELFISDLVIGPNEEMVFPASIEASIVPEPGSVCLMGLGVLALMSCRHQHRRRRMV